MNDCAKNSKSEMKASGAPPRITLQTKSPRQPCNDRNQQPPRICARKSIDDRFPKGRVRVVESRHDHVALDTEHKAQNRPKSEHHNPTKTATRHHRSMLTHYVNSITR